MLNTFTFDASSVCHSLGQWVMGYYIIFELVLSLGIPDPERTRLVLILGGLGFIRSIGIFYPLRLNYTFFCQTQRDNTNKGKN